MNRKLILLGVILLTKNILFAQNLSLDEAIEWGVKNRLDAQSNTIAIDIAKQNVQKVKNEKMPNITANGEAHYFPQLQTMIFDGFGGGGQTKIKVGEKNQSVFTLDLSYPVWKPEATINSQIAQNDVKIEIEKLHEKEKNIRFLIAEAYLNVLLKKEQLDLATEKDNRIEIYFTHIKEKYQFNSILINEFLKAQLDFENSKLNKTNATISYTQAMSNLKYELNITSMSNLILTDSLNGDSFKIPKEPSISKTEFPELNQLNLKNNMYLLELKKIKYSTLPTLSIVGNYTLQFQASGFNYFQNRWLPYNYIGLKASLPITEYLKKSTNRNIQYLYIKQNKIEIERKTISIQNEIEKTKYALANSENALKISKNNLELSRKLNIEQLKLYKIGTVSYSSVLETETAITTAEQNYLTAVYDFLLAKLNYEKAVGKL